MSTGRIFTFAEILKRTRQEYQRVDDQVRTQLLPKHRDVKCKKGCAGCCYQLVACTFLEALVVADFLIRNRAGELDTLLARMDEATALLEKPNAQMYMAFRKPCPFLKVTGQWTGECTVYGSRPLACRLEYVVTDPVNCAPTGVHEVGRLDTRQAHVTLVDVITGRNPVLGAYGPFLPFVAKAIRVRRDGEKISSDFFDSWLGRMQTMLANDREALEHYGIKERYIK